MPQQRGWPMGCKVTRDGLTRNVALEGAGDRGCPTACAGAPDTARRGVRRMTAGRK